MLVPILIAAPKTIGLFFKSQKSLQKCYQTPYFFIKNHPLTNVVYIPNEEDENIYIMPMFDKFYDGYSYITGEFFGFYGYGTTFGILITNIEIKEINNNTILMSDQVYQQNKNKINPQLKINENIDQQSKDEDKILFLALKIAINVDSIERNIDPEKGNHRMPSFAKYKPASFDLPKNISMSQIISSKFTILSLPINPDLNLKFAQNALDEIQQLQDAGFIIQYAQGFDIDEMSKSLSIGDISNKLIEDVNKLISNFPKISYDELYQLLLEIEPLSKDEKNYEQILLSPDFQDLSTRNIKSLISMLNYSYPIRNNFINEIIRIKGKYKIEKKEFQQVKQLINQLFNCIKVSPQLENKCNVFISQYMIDPNKISKKLFNVLQYLKNINNIKKQQKINHLLQICSNVFLLYSKFIKNNTNSVIQIQLILRSFENLIKFKFNEAKSEQIDLFIDNTTKVCNAVTTYCNFMNNQSNPKIKEIENLLFKLVFSPSEDQSSYTRIYSVYEMHDEFLFNADPFVIFKSSTGSGKTRCAPFFFSIKALMDNLKYPFFIMTQPSASIIADKMKDFQQILDNNVILIDSVPEMLKLYKKSSFQVPIVALFSPHNVLRLLTKANKYGIDIISRTRFCLDEIHERSVDTDVLIAMLSKQMLSRNTFPLQVLMMSATPDYHVLHCFGNVKQLIMKETQLFPVQTIKLIAKRKNDVSKLAANQTFDIIQKMANNEINVGHILIFSSGNSRINEIDKYLSDLVQSSNENKQNKIRLITDISFNDIKEFNSKIDSLTKNNEKTLFIIPIKFLSFVSITQKEIAKNPIKDHKNIIKVIMATNAIESSLTIEDLSVVVDTGIFNQPNFDPIKGLTTLSEETISLQSQAQRAGRVGRIQPGISIQISIKDMPFKESLPPDIQTSDISINILSLRKIGINLEDIDNLPEKIDPIKLNQFINELYSFNAIDYTTKSITKTGEKISKFNSLSPFLSFAIIEASSKYYNVQSLFEVLGSLIVLIFNSNDLVVNPYSKPLQDNFCDDSDIITILKTLLDLTKLKPSTWKIQATSYGLNSKTVIQVLGTVNNIAENLGFNKDDKIFSQLRDVCNKFDIMNFIQEIINNIQIAKKEWIDCRKARFYTIENITTTPLIVYIGGKDIVFDKEQTQSEISLAIRPGSKGLSCPGSAYIFNVSHNESMKINFGSFVHRNLEEEPYTTNNDYKIYKPKTICVDYSIYTQEHYVSPLLEAYLLEYIESGFHKFNSFRHTGSESGKVLFYISEFQDKGVITYAPLNKESDEIFQIAVKEVTKLLPYAPSSILIPHPILQCCISVESIGSDKYNSSVYFFKDNKCYPYQITKSTLDYMINNINKLNTYENKLHIAITGEIFSFSLVQRNINHNVNKRPTINPKLNYVFSDKDTYGYSHLIIISETPIPNQTPIPWTKNAIYAEYAPSDYICNVVNTICPDLISVKSCGKRVFFQYANGNSEIKIDGNYPVLLGEDENYYSTITKNRSIEAMFDKFAMGCINGSHLVQQVDLKSFQINGPKFNKYNIKRLKVKVDEVPNDYIEYLRIQDRLYQLRQLRKQQGYNSSNKEETNSLQNQLNHLPTQWDEQLKKDFPIYSVYEAAIKYKNSNLSEIKKLKTINKEHEIAIDVNEKMNETELNEYISKFIQNDLPGFVNVNAPLKTQIVPIYEVDFKHSVDSNLTKEEFTTKVYQITKQFGAIIYHISPYHENIINKNSLYQGNVITYMYTAEFSIPLAGMFTDEIFGEGVEILKIPNSVVNNALFKDRKIINIFKNWLQLHDLEIMQNGNKWVGKPDQIKLALELLHDSPPIFPYKTISIPGGINIQSLSLAIKIRNKSGGNKWFVDIKNKTISVPNEINDKKIKTFINKYRFKDNESTTNSTSMVNGDEILGDYIELCEENALLSKQLINVYYKNGVIKNRNYCRNCIRNSLIYELGQMYDKDTDRIRIDKMYENTNLVQPIQILETYEDSDCFYPIIPIGQMLWAFINDNDVANVARAFITAYAIRTLKSSPFITFCPNHPTILLKAPPSHTFMKCISTGCNFALCPECNQWHKINCCNLSTSVPCGYRICGNCNKIVEKTMACNHIACSCGKHFCYYCGALFNSSTECYQHMDNSKHWVEAPDYRKFVRGESVSQSELDTFYANYPHLRNQKLSNRYN